MIRTYLIAVGACAIDNILTVPYFPQEDSKLRALSLTKRRGGNCPNSLEVLSQLLDRFTFDASQKTRPSNDTIGLPAASAPKLSLIATLPSRSSPDIPFITSSFNVQKKSSAGAPTNPDTENVLVDLSRCIYREAFTEPISSYIICSQATSSRTIVNHNELPEMTVDEFIDTTANLLKSDVSDGADQLWFHFEGRIPETTLKCIQHLRRHFTSEASDGNVILRISVELEKPKREGLQELAYEADVIFYSRNWAEAEGYVSAEVCVMEQAKLLAGKGITSHEERTFVCTWGDQGACALLLPSHNSTTSEDQDLANHKVLYSPAYIDRENPVVDTVGAGDTFIAGIYFGLICRSRDGSTSRDFPNAFDVTLPSRRQPIWSLDQKVKFANEVAGRKVLQEGFQGLAEKLEPLVSDLDNTSEE